MGNIIRVDVDHTVDRLVERLTEIPTEAIRLWSAGIRAGVRRGREITRAHAKDTAGAHGKHYPAAIDAEVTGALEATWFQNPAKPQGGMAFEIGSWKQAGPHWDFRVGADAATPWWRDRMSDTLDELGIDR